MRVPLPSLNLHITNMMFRFLLFHSLLDFWSHTLRKAIPKGGNIKDYYAGIVSQRPAVSIVKHD